MSTLLTRWPVNSDPSILSSTTGAILAATSVAFSNALLRHVRPGVLYAVEDLQTSYWPSCGGDADPSAQGSSMVMVKSLLDGLNHQEQIRGSDHKPSMTELAVTGVHVHHDLAIIEKGRNTQQEAPSEWLDGRSTIKVLPDR